MPFQFVDNNAALSSKARRTIRIHAATGKNVGKTMNRRSKKTALPGRVTTLYRSRIAENNDGSPDPEENMAVAPKIDRLVGDSLSPYLFPVHVSPENRAQVLRGKCVCSTIRGQRWVNNNVHRY